MLPCQKNVNSPFKGMDGSTDAWRDRGTDRRTEKGETYKHLILLLYHIILYIDIYITQDILLVHYRLGILWWTLLHVCCNNLELARR